MEITSLLAPATLAFLKERGVDPAPLIEQFSLPPGADSALELRIEANVLRELLEAGATRIDDPFLGLHLGQWLRKGRYGLMEFISRTAPTLRHALGQLARYGSLVNDLAAYGLTELGDEALMEQRTVSGKDVFGRHWHEHSLAIIHRTGQELMGKPWPLRRVFFVTPPPSRLEPLVEQFGTDALEFNARSSGLAFSAGLLEAPTVSGDSALHEFLERQAVGVLRDRPRTTDEFDARVREKLKAALEAGQTGIEQVAKQLHMSGRTLQRRLADHGTSFQDLLDEVREKLARMYLTDRRLALSEVAYLLGYSDLRAFVRAFKRWTGKTPGEYRGG